MGIPLQAKGIAPVQPDSAKSSQKTTAKPTSCSCSCAASPAKTPAAKAPESKPTPIASSKPSTVLRPTSSSRPASLVSSRHSVGSEHLARLTAYWAGEGDYYTGHGMSSTGIHLHSGHCAVDPRVIPYGSVVTIPGLGNYLAVDTGSAVVSREAARETGHNSEERNALVIDIYFESRADGQHFANSGPKFAPITWASPTSVGANTQEMHSPLGEDNGTKDL